LLQRGWQPFEEAKEGAMMSASEVLSQFSRNRLGGEPVPEDLKVLLHHRDELAERTGLWLEWAEDWAPWRAASDLDESQRQNADVVANARAIAEVCRHIAFVAADEEDEYLGYWRGPSHRRVADSPLVFLDNTGQFHLCVASNFAEAVLEREYGGEQFAELRAWLKSLGIPIGWESPAQLTFPHEKLPPRELHKQLLDRYRRQVSHGG
jgi:hypothetical protein